MVSCRLCIANALNPARPPATGRRPPLQPFLLSDFLAEHAEALAAGGSPPLFGVSHPDNEFSIDVVGGPSELSEKTNGYDTWFYQLSGQSWSCPGPALVLP